MSFLRFLLSGLLAWTAFSGEASEKPVVVLETTEGTMEVVLFPEVAPKTCENFLGLVKNHYYDGIVFHRIIRDFMIQGGDPSGTGRGGNSIWGKPFKDEFSAAVRFDRPGLLAMANSGPNTNGSQFFITTVKTPWLNMRHTIFGEILRGKEVLDKIEKVKTVNDAPVVPVKILRAYTK